MIWYGIDTLDVDLVWTRYYILYLRKKMCSFYSCNFIHLGRVFFHLISGAPNHPKRLDPSFDDSTLWVNPMNLPRLVTKSYKERNYTLTTYYSRWWQLKYFWCSPLFGEDEPNLKSIFFRWVVQPPSSILKTDLHWMFFRSLEGMNYCCI